MKNVLLYITAALFLTACGTMKKSVNKQESKTEAKSDSVFKTTTTETVDTNVVIPGDTTKGNIDIADTAAQVIETPDLVITFDSQKPGSKKRKITVVQKPKIVPVRITRTTNNEGRVVKQSKAESESKVVDKKRTASIFSIFPWWIWLLIIITALVFIAWKFKLYRYIV